MAAGKIEQKQPEQHSGDKVGVVLEPRAVELGIGGVVLFGMVRVVADGERVVGLDLDGGTEISLVGCPVDHVGEANRVVGKVCVHTRAVDLVALTDEGAVRDLGLGLEPVVGMVLVQYLFERRHAGNCTVGSPFIDTEILNLRSRMTIRTHPCLRMDLGTRQPMQDDDGVRATANSRAPVLPWQRNEDADDKAALEAVCSNGINRGRRDGAALPGDGRKDMAGWAETVAAIHG